MLSILIYLSEVRKVGSDEITEVEIAFFKINYDTKETSDKLSSHVLPK